MGWTLDMDIEARRGVGRRERRRMDVDFDTGIVVSEMCGEAGVVVGQCSNAEGESEELERLGAGADAELNDCSENLKLNEGVGV